MEILKSEKQVFLVKTTLYFKLVFLKVTQSFCRPLYIPIAFYCHIKRKIWLKIVLKYSLYFKNSTIFEQKFFFEYFFNFLFLSKMLSFQDFSKWTNILKSTVQYLSRDISTIKIGQFLRQSHKKHRKPLFCPTALKIKKLTYHPTSFLITFHTIFF